MGRHHKRPCRLLERTGAELYFPPWVDGGEFRRQMALSWHVRGLPDGTFILHDQRVSNRHAAWAWNDENEITVVDSSSRGTYVNGSRITAPTILRLQDLVDFGRSGHPWRLRSASIHVDTRDITQVTAPNLPDLALAFEGDYSNCCFSIVGSDASAGPYRGRVATVLLILAEEFKADFGAGAPPTHCGRMTYEHLYGFVRSYGFRDATRRSVRQWVYRAGHYLGPIKCCLIARRNPGDLRLQPPPGGFLFPDGTAFP